MHYLLIHSSQPENKKVGHYPCSSSSITGLQSETTEIYISVCVCVCVCGGGGARGLVLVFLKTEFVGASTWQSPGQYLFMFYKY